MWSPLKRKSKEWTYSYMMSDLTNWDSMAVFGSASAALTDAIKGSQDRGRLVPVSYRIYVDKGKTKRLAEGKENNKIITK